MMMYGQDGWNIKPKWPQLEWQLTTMYNRTSWNLHMECINYILPETAHIINGKTWKWVWMGHIEKRPFNWSDFFLARNHDIWEVQANFDRYGLWRLIFKDMLERKCQVVNFAGFHLKWFQLLRKSSINVFFLNHCENPYLASPFLKNLQKKSSVL